MRPPLALLLVAACGTPSDVADPSVDDPPAETDPAADSEVPPDTDAPDSDVDTDAPHTDAPEDTGPAVDDDTGRPAPADTGGVPLADRLADLQGRPLWCASVAFEGAFPWRPFLLVIDPETGDHVFVPTQLPPIHFAGGSGLTRLGDTFVWMSRNEIVTYDPVAHLGDVLPNAPGDAPPVGTVGGKVAILEEDWQSALLTLPASLADLAYGAFAPSIRFEVPEDWSFGAVRDGEVAVLSDDSPTIFLFDAADGHATGSVATRGRPTARAAGVARTAGHLVVLDDPLVPWAPVPLLWVFDRSGRPLHVRQLPNLGVHPFGIHCEAAVIP